MRISQMHGRGWPVFSFEFFPPRSDQGARNLLATVADLRDALKPDFVSVTYGAGGSTRERTLECITAIQRELRLTAMAHLTCVGSSEEELCQVVGRLVGNGVENVLALRGDPPRREDGTLGDFEVEPGGFGHATELIGYLEDNYQLDVGAACYPEGHIESASHEEDLRWTCRKVELGASFLLTQLFFDNEHYFRFVDRARAAGIHVPIVPGIMPITNVGQVERFTKMCGATIPPELAERLQRLRDDPAAIMATGIEHAIRQCRGLLAQGAPGVHFYTLNKSHATRSVLAALRRD